MGFDAGKSVEALEFDFTTLNPCPDELKDAKGVIPEPDIETLNDFSEGFYGLLRMTRQLTQLQRPAAPEETEDTDAEADERIAADPDAVHTMIQEWHEGLGNSNDPARKELEDSMIDWLLLVCRPVLTYEQLRVVPGRVRSAFVAWLAGELITPKGSLSASVPSPEVTEG